MPTFDQINFLNEYKRYKFVSIPLIGKRPFFKKWTEIPHTPKEVEVFNNKNIGILTGRRSKITILDIDYQDEGIAHWNKIKKLYPEIKTPIVATPGRGIHLYFKYNPKLSSTSKLHLGEKIIGWDILNDGRVVVAPPSKGYKWVESLQNVSMAKMPYWLEQYILLLKS